MKKALLFLFFAFAATAAFAQQTWKELEDYHNVMAATFHPSEEGNLQPVKTRSGELATKAKTLKGSTIPTEYKKPGVEKTLSLLAKESKALDKLVKKGGSDADITKAITALHDRFHELVEKCRH